MCPLRRWWNIVCIFLCYYYYCAGSSAEIHGPTFNPELPDHVDFSNSTGLTLVCSAWGIPSPTVRWIHANGNPLSNVKNLRSASSNGTLYFPPFQAEGYRQDVHASVYRCLASNLHGTVISKEVHVRAVVKQFYEVHVYDEFVIRGNTAVLKCYIPSFVRDYIALTSWTVESSEKSTTVVRNNEKYSLFLSGELHIRNVTAADGMHYRCHTRHQLTGETRSSISSGRLIVTETKNTVPPRLTHSRSALTAQQGGTVQLPCAAQGYPIPTYSWYRVKDTHTSLLEPENGVRLFSGTLQLENVQVDDSGTYHCVVNNSAGVERTDTLLTVTVPLSIKIEPSYQVVDVGKSAAFQCRTSGFPTPHITWWKDGRILVPERRIILIAREVLRVDSVQREDKGMYQCFAQNAHSSVQASAELKLGDAAPQLLHKFGDRTLQPGSSISLKCVASGNPPPSVRWTVDDHVITNSERFILEQRVNQQGDVISFVNVSKIQAENSGQFQCTASNKVGKTYHSGRINVYGPPSIRPFRNITTIAGNSLVIHCHVKGHPIHSIMWERDGVTLPINHRQKIFLNGTLLIHNIQRTLDAGAYTCIARDDQGRTAKNTVHILVLNPPKISPFYFPSDIQQGMRAIVTCSVIYGDLPIIITWLKDEKPVQSNNGITIKNVEDLTSTLILHNVTPQNNGNYTCTATNGAASVSHLAELLVRVPPRWLSEPMDQAVVSEHSVTVHCQAEGSPKPSISWKKAVGRLPEEYASLEGSHGHYIIHNNGSLTLKKASKADEGFYLCQASSGVGAEISKVVRLKVHVPAYFESKIIKLAARKGSNAKLICEANGDLPITFIWKMESQRLDLSPTSRFTAKEHQTVTGYGSELVVMKTERSDSTEFSCIAANAFGKDEMKIELVIQEVPQSPRNVNVISQGSRSVHVTWMPGYDGNSPIIRHLVSLFCSEVSKSFGGRNVSTSGSETRAIVDGLRPALKYELKVAAENSVGIGSWSESVWVSTEEEVPEEPPQNVHVESIDSQTIRVQWKPPKKEFCNGKILGYHVGFREQDSEDDYQFTATDVDAETGGQLLLSDLKKYTPYYIVVKAYNRIGSGPLTPETLISTLADVPSQPPREIACVPSSSQSLRVSWIPPVDYAIHGILRGYKLSFAVAEAINNKEFKSTPELDIDLDNLQKFTNYSIQVAAFTDAGDGVASKEIFCKTEEDVPNAPKEIKVLVMSSDAIIVSWRPPSRPNGIITKYIVYTQILEDSQQMPSTHVLPSNQLYFEARGLQETHHYQFWVAASTSVGEGEKTHIVSKSPISTVPARIASFSETFFANRKSDIKLPCRAVGIPTPDREWLLRGQPVQQTSRLHVLTDGSLLITSIRNADAGNYTCKVHNIYASDEIVQEVIVHASQDEDHPPAPPVLVMTRKTASSILVTWKVTEEGLNPIKGFMLNYKREDGEWEEVTLTSNKNSHQLETLACGTRFQVFMKAFNAAGSSEPSEMISVTTKGSVPEVPEKIQILSVNSTFVVVHPQVWPDGGCPIHTIITEYKGKEENEWTLVSRTLRPMRDIIVSGLSPGISYSLKLSAHNDAGMTSVEYEIFTLGTSGEAIDLNHVSNHSDNRTPFYKDVNVVIPLISTAILVVFILLSACLFIKFRHGFPHRQKQAVRTSLVNKSKFDHNETKFDENYSKDITENITNDDTHQMDVKKCVDNKDVISPYATCQISSSRYDRSPGRQFFSDCYYDSVDVDDRTTVTLAQYPKIRKKLPRNAQCLVSETILCRRKNFDMDHTTTIPKQDEAYFEPNRKCPITPDITPLSKSEKQRPLLQHVPDILDHYPDSSFSNKSSSDEDSGSTNSNNRDSLPTTKQLIIPDSVFHSKSNKKPISKVIKTTDDVISRKPRTKTGKTQRSPSKILDIEEELIAQLRRGSDTSEHVQLDQKKSHLMFKSS